MIFKERLKMNMKHLLLSGCLLIFFCFSVQAQDFDSKLNDAQTALMNGNFESCLSECESLIAGGEGDSLQQAMIYSYAGFASEKLDKLTAAITYYKKAIQFKVPRLDIYDKVISLSKKVNNNADGEFALLEKRKAFPEFQTSIVESLAYLYLEMEQYDKLIAVTNELIEWFPTNPTFLNFQGIAFQNSGQIDKAEVAYKKVLELDPDHSYANMGMGMILYNKASKIYDDKRDHYSLINKPTQVDYYTYRKALEEPKSIYRLALPYLLKAYEDESFSSLKAVLFKLYTRLEEKDKTLLYR
ncbi:MAG: hypothetical protein WAO52_09755 [Prolixibacteraceae bacterium]